MRGQTHQRPGTKIGVSGKISNRSYSTHIRAILDGIGSGAGSVDMGVCGVRAKGVSEQGHAAPDTYTIKR